jgi:putative nucleotidyltransferase-like protein
MKTFEQVVMEASQYGSINLLFEQGMYSLMDDLERIVTVLREANVPFEVVGGVAVNAHVLGVKRSRSFVTRDIDLLVQRHDLEKIVAAAQSAGYVGKRIMGGFMLIRHDQEPEEAVHLLFVGEKPRSTHPFPNPALHPEDKHLPQFGITIPVARLSDLVQMKLNSFRPKDETHLETLDKCGLITAATESDLPMVLKERLAQARKRYTEDSEF